MSKTPTFFSSAGECSATNVLVAFIKDFVQTRYHERLLYLAERPKRHHDVVMAMTHCTELGILRADQVTQLSFGVDTPESCERRLQALGAKPPIAVLDWSSIGCLPLREAVSASFDYRERIIYSPSARLALFCNHAAIPYMLLNGRN